MLNKLDDYPIHQTPEPIAHPATSDRNAYDRTWFNGYSQDGTRYLGIGMAIYPHRGILDCAFSVVEQPGTRLASSAEIDLIDLRGIKRTISLKPLLKFQMKGLGYSHPQWGQGMWKGELEIGGESFDPQTLSPLAPEHVHVQQVVHASDGSQAGIGVLEQAVIGPYAPAGFVDVLDGAKA